MIYSKSLKHNVNMFGRLPNSGQDGNGEVQVAELGAGQDLEVVGHRQGRVPRRGGVRARHAPHPGQDRRTRPPTRPAAPPHSSLQEELNLLSAAFFSYNLHL